MKNGKKEFAVLPYEEFLAVQERLADAEDLLELRKAKRAEQRKNRSHWRMSSVNWGFDDITRRCIHAASKRAEQR